MKDTMAWTATEWTAASGSSEPIFPSDPAEARALYRRLMRRWHPDGNPDPQATAVTATIQVLYRRSRSATPSTLPTVDIVDEHGRHFRFKALDQQPFELGVFLRARRRIAWHVRTEHVALAQAFARRAQGWQFSHPEMRAQMAPLLPRLDAVVVGPDAALLVLHRDPGLVRLRDVIGHFQTQEGGMPARHAAWIVSGLYHLACYLEISGVVHQAISIDTVWIHPQQHSVHLLGGWFHTREQGEPVQTLPLSSMDCVDRRYRQEKCADARLDRALVRAVGREILGDRQGLRLPLDLPSPLREALCLPGGSSALADYRHWREALAAAFGPPTFVPMPLTASNLYKENFDGR